MTIWARTWLVCPIRQMISMLQIVHCHHHTIDICVRMTNIPVFLPVWHSNLRFTASAFSQIRHERASQAILEDIIISEGFSWLVRAHSEVNPLHCNDASTLFVAPLSLLCLTVLPLYISSSSAPDSSQCLWKGETAPLFRRFSLSCKQLYNHIRVLPKQI